MRTFVSLCLLLFLSSTAAAQEYRTWTSANGQHTFEAEFLSFENGTVELKGRDGKVKKLDSQKLSESDRTYLTGLSNKSSDTPEKGEVSDAQKEALEKFGLRVYRNELMFLDERDLKAEVSKSLKAKKTLLGHELELQKLRLTELQAENQLVLMKQKDVQLNAGLATASGAVENNRYIAMINANASQVDLLLKDMSDLAKQVKAGQSFVNKASDEFVKQLLDVRGRLDAFDAKAKSLAEDQKLAAVVKEIEQTIGSEIEPLGESRSLARMRSNLEKLESIILTDTVKLTDDGSGTFEATISINGYDVVQLVVDSGASLVCLPSKMADELGLEIGPDAQPIQMTIADGSIISGKLITLDSVRMGKFEAENVQCAVLGPEAVNAPGLLGMSFLGNFKFELDASKGEIKMMTIDPDATK